MLFLIIIPCILCFVYAWRRRRRYLQGRLPPSCGFSWPIIGLAHMWARGSFWNRLLDIQLDCLRQGGVSLLYSGINPRYTYYAVCDPEDSVKVADSCLERTFLLEDSIKELLGESLVTAPVPVWETRRRFLEQSFEQLSKSIAVPNQEAGLLIEELEVNIGKGAFDHKVYMQRVVMRILCINVLGLRHDEDDFSRIVDLCLKTMDQISYILYLRHINFFMHNKVLYNCSRIKRRQEDGIAGISDLIAEIVNRKKDAIKNQDIEEHQQAGEKTKGLADVLIELEENGVYTEEQMIKELISMIFSGYDTMTTTLTATLYLLGSNANMLNRVNDEIDKVFKGSPVVQMDEVVKLKYLEAVVLETLRLYSPVTMTTRAVSDELKLKKYNLEAGSKCLLSIYALHRHAVWGAEKDEFKPERWIDNDALKERLAAFGIGKRNCIAKQFSLSIIQVILVNILRKYNVSTSGANMKMKQEILLTPVAGYHIVLHQKRMPV